jgi:hypothetical protein
MFLAAEIIAGVVALGSLAFASALLFRRKKNQTPWAEFVKSGWRYVGFGFFAFVAALTNLFLLSTGYVGPFVALGGLFCSVLIGYAMSRVDLHDFFEQLGNVGHKNEK